MNIRARRQYEALKQLGKDKLFIARKGGGVPFSSSSVLLSVRCSPKRGTLAPPWPPLDPPLGGGGGGGGGGAVERSPSQGNHNGTYDAALNLPPRVWGTQNLRGKGPSQS